MNPDGSILKELPYRRFTFKSFKTCKTLPEDIQKRQQDNRSYYSKAKIVIESIVGACDPPRVLSSLYRCNDADLHAAFGEGWANLRHNLNNSLQKSLRIQCSYQTLYNDVCSFKKSNNNA